MAVKYEAISKFHSEITDPGRGKHLWVVTAAFQLIAPEKFSTEQVHMDMENLLTIEGPVCWKCEQHFSADRARRFCQGVM